MRETAVLVVPAAMVVIIDINIFNCYYRANEKAHGLFKIGRACARIIPMFEKIKQYFKEVRVEMAKVKWPTKSDTINYTIVVIGVSLAVAAFLGALDFIFTYLFNIFLFK